MDASFLEGVWVGGEAAEVWVRDGDRWRGVGLGPDGFFEVLEVTGDAYVVRGVGDEPVSFALVRAKADAAVWANPAHDAPKRIAYTRTGTAMVARVSGGFNATFRFVAAKARPVPGVDLTGALASGRSPDDDTGFVIWPDRVVIYRLVDGTWQEHARF